MPSERGQSAGSECARSVFYPSLDPVGHHLGVRQPLHTTILNRHPVLDCLWLWPRRHPIQEDFFQRPHVVSHTTWKVMSRNSDALKNFPFEIKGLRKWP